MAVLFIIIRIGLAEPCFQTQDSRLPSDECHRGFPAMVRIMVSLFQMLSLGSAADDVSYEDVQVGGYICGTSQKARVYFLTAEGQYPLISFAHGYLAGGGVATFG